MASALNKRQQARNERALQELIKTVPGNGQCADCAARNPGWASWSLGIFLCMRCATLHRKLGTHISKVKSLSMDKWDNAQVDNMKRIGNTESNKAYNPRNVKPSIPVDIDEVDSAMERFIRQKYEQRAFMGESRPGTRQNTGSTSSAEDRPPPLPPKPTKRFGFGLQKSATLPRNVTPPVSPGLSQFESDTSPPRVNKPSRVFGSNVSTSGDGMESKLATLRDMGFPDEKRNSTVLKGLNGNLDRAVEALIRLGEQNPALSRGPTPTLPTKPGANGLSFDTPPASTSSMNPFDALDAVAPLPQQQSQPAPIQTQQMPYSGQSFSQTTSPTNPFLPAVQQGFTQQRQPYAQQQNYAQQQQGLEQSFQGLQLSNQQSQQPLFPNRTGGYGQAPTPQHSQTNPFQQSFTPPPMPQIPQQYNSFFQQQQPTGYQPISSPTGGSNPFLKSTRSQMFSPSNLSNQTSASNPFGQALSQPQPQQQAQYQAQAQQQPHYQTQPQSQPQIQTQQTATNPFMMPHQTPSSAVTPSAPNPWQDNQGWNGNQQQQQQQQQQQVAYQTPRAAYDKNTILSLYNYPQLAPQRTQTEPVPEAAPTPASAAPAVPAPGSMNPFAAGQAAGAQGGFANPSTLQNQGTRHVSHESVDFAGLMGGRHSPDAFSGLSASFRR